MGVIKPQHSLSPTVQGITPHEKVGGVLPSTGVFQGRGLIQMMGAEDHIKILHTLRSAKKVFQAFSKRFFVFFLREMDVCGPL